MISKKIPVNIRIEKLFEKILSEKLYIGKKNHDQIIDREKSTSFSECPCLIQ